MINRDYNTKKKPGFTLVEVIISLGVFGLIIGSLFSLLPWGVDKANGLVDRNTALGMVDAVQIELERLGFSVVEHGTKRLDDIYDGKLNNDPVDSRKQCGLILVATKNGQRVSLEKVIMVEQGKPINFGDFTDGKGEALKKTSKKSHDIDGEILFERHDGRPISLNGFVFPADKQFLSRWIEPEERYFAIICSQFAKHPGENSEPPSRHMHHPSNGYLALQVDVQWPYKIFDPSQTENVRIVEPRYRSKISFPVAISR
jgi:prepilin-type N-terminal cleavage/methylation domain-containing protein